MVDAYDRLVARGVIESRAGRGFFVTRRQGAAGAAGHRSRAGCEFGSRCARRARRSRSLASAGDVIAAGSGFLPTAWYAEALPANVLSRLTHQRRPQAWMPCPPQGLGELREQLAERLVQKGIACGPANLTTTFGASRAFDLLARILFAPGDTVLVEDPGYFVLFEQLRALHLKLVPVPRTSSRSDIDALEEACRIHQTAGLLPADAASQPDRHEHRPGGVPSLAVARRDLRLRHHRRRRVRRLVRRPAVRLAQLDGLKHVIYVGSFTKLLGPALRLGFVAADSRVIAQIVERKVLSVLSGSALLESITSEALDSGRFLRHTQTVRGRLARMRRDAQAALESAGVSFDDVAGDGIFPRGDGCRTAWISKR